MTFPTAAAQASSGDSYDPWRQLATDWPEIEVRHEPLTGRLLGELRYPVIVLRRDSSPAQQRCTLAHELVHLERGILDCGPWLDREERTVELVAARRLITPRQLVTAVRELGDDADLRRLAVALEVDRQTLRTRLDALSRAERRQLNGRSSRRSWHVA